MPRIFAEDSSAEAPNHAGLPSYPETEVVRRVWDSSSMEEALVRNICPFGGGVDKQQSGMRTCTVLPGQESVLGRRVET